MDKLIITNDNQTRYILGNEKGLVNFTILRTKLSSLPIFTDLGVHRPLRRKRNAHYRGMHITTNCPYLYLVGADHNYCAYDGTSLGGDIYVGASDTKIWKLLTHRWNNAFNNQDEN